MKNKEVNIPHLQLVLNGCQFRQRMISFSHDDLRDHFGLDYKGMQFDQSILQGFIRVNFIEMISKSLFKDHLISINFSIIQMKCEIRIFHYVIVKILYRKEKNWVRANDQD